MDPIEQNGVTFTPTKVVNLDEFFKTDISKPDLNNPPAPDPDPIDTTDPNVAAAPAATITDEGAANTAPSDNDDQDYDLDEFRMDLGDESFSANELLDRYESQRSELDEIKNDEFLSKFISFYKNGGDPSEFLQKATAKWENEPEVSLLRREFDSVNSDIDDAEVKEMLFERKLRETYGVNPDGTFDDEDSRDARIGKQLMKRDADKYRSARIEEQKAFLLKEPAKQSQQKTQYDPAKEAAELMQDKELQSFITKKALPVSDTFSYSVEDPTKVIEMMANVGEFWKVFAKTDGSYDKQALAKVFAFALNPKGYDDALLKLGKDSGAEDYLKEQRNTSGKAATVISTGTDKDNVVVRNGKIVGGNDREGFLKQMVAQKR